MVRKVSPRLTSIRNREPVPGEVRPARLEGTARLLQSRDFSDFFFPPATATTRVRDIRRCGRWAPPPEWRKAPTHLVVSGPSCRRPRCSAPPRPAVCCRSDPKANGSVLLPAAARWTVRVPPKRKDGAGFTVALRRGSCFALLCVFSPLWPGVGIPSRRGVFPRRGVSYLEFFRLGEFL